MSSSRGGLLTRLHSMFDRSDIGFAAPARDGTGDADEIRPTATRYAPIRDAVERRINAFLREDLVSHLEIGFNEIFLLHYIEIVADDQAKPALAQFLHEFSPESRALWIKRLLGGAVGQHVSVDQFLGLDREFTAEQLAETDPFEEKLNQAATPLYRVILHGRWEARAPAEPSAPPAANRAPSAEPSLPAAPRLVLSVRDARSPGKEPRTVEIERFPAVVGSTREADVELSGYYVSARHCTLHWDGQSVLLTDHSTNGTWVDGERVRRGVRVALPNNALLGFGRDQADEDCDRYPAVRAQVLDGPLTMGDTPVSPSRPTPVASGIAVPTAVAHDARAALAVLAIADANGNVRRDVIRLPFTIGRGSVQDYVVPEANQGVSREHLVIEEIVRAGAVTFNRAAGRNGTFAGTQALPERFVWRFGQEIALGERWAGAPAVRVSLQPAGEAL